MTKEAFDHTLRALMQRMPFQPFLVEFTSGTRLLIEAPRSVAWAAGRAAYLDAEGSPTIFDYEDVLRFIDPPETAFL